MESIDDIMPPAPYNEQPTLRDRFAMAFLAADAVDVIPTDMELYADRAYLMADAMMEARKA